MIWLPTRLDRLSFTTAADLEAAAWAIFQKDFSAFPPFRTEDVRVIRAPHKARADQGHTYWHMVTEGEREETRGKSISDRLERVPWARPVIENEADVGSAMKVWSNQRSGNTHVCIWFDRQNYLVVLKQCADHYLLKTTYCPESWRRQQLHREYTAWKKNGARL